MNDFYNFLLGLLFIVLGIYFIYSTYKQPDSFLNSTDIKGYLAGISFIFIGIMNLLGKFDILNILNGFF